MLLKYFIISIIAFNIVLGIELYIVKNIMGKNFFEFLNSESLNILDDLMYLFIFAFVFIIPLVITLSIIVLILSKKLKKDLVLLEEASEKVLRGQIKYKVKYEDHSIKDFENLSRNFNELSSKLEKQTETMQRIISDNKNLTSDIEKSASIEERRKIARELHDSISQHLFATNMMLSSCEKLIDNSPENCKKYIKHIKSSTEQAQQELRALIMHLRPIKLEGKPLYIAIADLLNDLEAKNTSIKFRKDINKTPNIEKAIEDNLFRVVQEAISNIVRHSKATTLSIKLFEKSDLLFLFIEDNGIGIDTENNNTSYGLETMKERVEEVGGNFNIISIINKGTRLEIRVPIGLSSIFKK